MNKSTQKIFPNNGDEISEKIKKIESSLVGVDYHHADRENYVEGLPFPIVDERKTIDERMAEHNIPGLCIAVINNYKIEWAKCFGFRNINTKEPITLDTIFQAASITKPIMAILTLHLVEKGLLDIDEPVNKKLKDWQIPDNEFTKEKKITLRHLLTHSSGMNMPFRGFGREEGSAPTLLQTLKGETPAKNDPAEVTFKPGTKHQYSNFGFIIIEKLLQDVTGKNLQDIANEILFEPLGMRNSFLKFPTKELQKRMIYPHNYKGDVYEPHVGLSPRVFGCGGLITTPIDISTFAIELMNAYQGNSEKILSQSMVKEMISHKITLDPIYNFDSTAQGLGIFLCEKENEFFFTHRGGGEPGSSSLFMTNPESGHGVAVMANSNVGHQLFQSFKFTLAKEYEWSMWIE
ncbi:MAG: serine hydrolase domain-containing protein [Candidatus Heimdallarchaeota archaeon]